MWRLRHILVGSLAFTGACSDAPASKSPADLLVDECRKITGVSGTYSWTQVAVPVVTPVATQGGTQRGATILNACIDSRTNPNAASDFDGSASNVDPTVECPKTKKKSSNVFAGGGLYCS
ncbi:MAG: hypothetical protein AAFU69_01785 [Pseudomonadota bacterium]